MKYILYLISTIAIFNLSLSQCYADDSFTDLDGNDSWTANETLTNDCNGNGVWDSGLENIDDTTIFIKPLDLGDDLPNETLELKDWFLNIVSKPKYKL